MGEQVLADMEAEGVRPSNVTVAALLRHHGQAGDVDRAISVFEELPKQHGLELDARAYGALISVCLTNERLDLAANAFERMNAAGLRADAWIYENMIVGFMQNGDLRQATELAKDTLR